jgi:hypothetical protein
VCEMPPSDGAASLKLGSARMHVAPSSFTPAPLETTVTVGTAPDRDTIRTPRSCPKHHVEIQRLGLPSSLPLRSVCFKLGLEDDQKRLHESFTNDQPLLCQRFTALQERLWVSPTRFPSIGPPNMARKDSGPATYLNDESLPAPSMPLMP